MGFHWLCVSTNGQVYDAMKRSAVWVIIICYLFVCVGFVVDTGCCHEDHAQDPASEGCHNHVSTKVLTAVHAFSHLSPADIHTLLAKKYCCVSQGEGSPYAAHHPVVMTYRTAKTYELPRNAIPLHVISFWSSLRVGPCGVVYNSACMPSTHRSIHSTVLLI